MRTYLVVYYPVISYTGYFEDRHYTKPYKDRMILTTVRSSWERVVGIQQAVRQKVGKGTIAESVFAVLCANLNINKPRGPTESNGTKTGTAWKTKILQRILSARYASICSNGSLILYSFQFLTNTQSLQWRLSFQNITGINTNSVPGWGAQMMINLYSLLRTSRKVDVLS